MMSLTEKRFNIADGGHFESLHLFEVELKFHGKTYIRPKFYGYSGSFPKILECNFKKLNNIRTLNIFFSLNEEMKIFL